MRLSVEGTPGGPTAWSARFAATRRHAAAIMATLIMLATMGVSLRSFAKPAVPTLCSGPDRSSSSIGFSEADVYDSGLRQPAHLADRQHEQPVHRRQCLRPTPRQLLCRRRVDRRHQRVDSPGEPAPTFATGLANPAGLVFDSMAICTSVRSAAPTSSNSRPRGRRCADIGPLQTELYGDDWIDLSSDQCTFYYTSERTDIMRYNMCTNTQLPNFNVAPLPGPRRLRTSDPAGRERARRRLERRVLARPQRERHPDLPVLHRPSRLCRASSTPSPSTRAAPRSGWAMPTSGLVWTRSTSNSGRELQTIDTQSGLSLRAFRRGGGDRGNLATTVPADPTSPDDPTGDEQLLDAHDGLRRADRQDDGQSDLRRADHLHPRERHLHQPPHRQQRNRVVRHHAR